MGGANGSVGGCIYGDTDKCKALVQLGVTEKCDLDKMQGLLTITDTYSVLQIHKPQGGANDSVGGCIYGETDKYKTCVQLGMIGKVWFWPKLRDLCLVYRYENQWVVPMVGWVLQLCM